MLEVHFDELIEESKPIISHPKAWESAWLQDISSVGQIFVIDDESNMFISLVDVQRVAPESVSLIRCSKGLRIAQSPLKKFLETPSGDNPLDKHHLAAFEWGMALEFFMERALYEMALAFDWNTPRRGQARLTVQAHFMRLYDVELCRLYSLASHIHEPT
jgi:hypothetical protein